MGASAIALDFVIGPPCQDNIPLSKSLAAAPISLGFFLSDRLEDEPPIKGHIASRGSFGNLAPWQAAGAETSCRSLLELASGSSANSLAADEDGLVRSVPVFTAVGNGLYPSLAVDGIRIFLGLGAVILSNDPPSIIMGNETTKYTVPIDEFGEAKIRPTSAEQQRQRTVSAIDILSGQVEDDQFSGNLVLVGSSAPQFGGLRQTAGHLLRASVQIHADFANNIILENIPTETKLGILYNIIIITIILTISILVSSINPIFCSVNTFGVVICTIFVSWYIYYYYDLIIDPTLLILSAIVSYISTGIVEYSRIRKEEALIREKFEQRMPAHIVSKIVSNPKLFKLEGELRETTSLFTDIEDFAKSTERSQPVELIKLLDSYFTQIARIVISKGGMVDKTIGDGLHAMFNAPIDLPGHADVAVNCALEILEFSEKFRSRPEAIRVQMGRTRIGIETGDVVMGDIGYSKKIDYTAVGSSINIASRLQEENKKYGTSILVGSNTKSKMKSGSIKFVGKVKIRGIGERNIYTVERNVN